MNINFNQNKYEQSVQGDLNLFFDSDNRIKFNVNTDLKKDNLYAKFINSLDNPEIIRKKFQDFLQKYNQEIQSYSENVWTPSSAYRYCSEFGRVAELEKILINDLEQYKSNGCYLLSYFWMYLRDVVKTRWIEAENIIVKLGARFVYNYAEEVNGGKVPEDMLNQILIKDDDDVLATCKYAISGLDYFAHGYGKLPENLHNQIVAFFMEHPDNKYIKAYLEFIETNSRKAWTACF